MYRLLNERQRRTMKAENLLKLVEEECARMGGTIRSRQVKALIVVLAKLLPTSVEIENIHSYTSYTPEKRRCDKIGCEGHGGDGCCNDSDGCNDQFVSDTLENLPHHVERD